MATKKKPTKYPNLMCVKSILTIIISVGFVALCFIHPQEYEDTMKTVIVSVITFYFSHQIGKSQHDTTDGKDDTNANDKR